MVLRIAVAICAVTLLVAAGGAWASGEWYWAISANPSTGTPYYTGVAGSADPIILQGAVTNNDPQNRLLFNGVTFKTDDLDPSDLDLYGTLWNTDPSVDFPECLSVTGGGQENITIGRFNLASAPTGTYRFRFIGAAGYDSIAANPSQMNSGFVTIEVVPVPEPGSLLGLGTALAALVLSRRRKGLR